MLKALKFMFFLLAGAILGSCGGKESIAEEISVSPVTVAAKASMDNYKLEVTSNARWTVSTDATWLELSQTSGHDNAVVTVRVYENKLTSPRGAAIVFKTAAGKSFTVSLTQEGKEDEGGTEATVLRIGTYNLRMSGLDKEGDNVWSQRKERLKQSLIACNFDVFGIQEVSTETQTWLDSELSNKYTFKYFSPYSQSGTGDKAQGIGYRKGAFTLSDWHFFWASATPDKMAYNDTGDEGNFKRGGCCCVLSHKSSGVKLFIINNHGCLNSESNIAASPYYIVQEKRFNTAGLPSFFVGDMNLRESSEEGSSYKIFTAYWMDPYRTLDASARSGPEGSYNGFKYPGGRHRIDYVFYRGEGFAPKSYRCDDSLYGGKYASDHFPVWVDFEFTE